MANIKGIIILAEQTQRLPNTTLLAVPGIDGEMLLMKLDRAGFAVSSGSACAMATALPSHVLRAMQVPTDLAECVIRVSFGDGNKPAEVAELLEMLGQINKDCRLG